MLEARTQAERYARNLPAAEPPRPSLWSSMSVTPSSALRRIDAQGKSVPAVP